METTIYSMNNIHVLTCHLYFQSFDSSCKHICVRMHLVVFLHQKIINDLYHDHLVLVLRIQSFGRIRIQSKQQYSESLLNQTFLPMFIDQSYIEVY